MQSKYQLTSHQLDDVRSSLVEDDLQVLGVTLLEFLLKKTTAMLIFAQAVDLVARHRLQVVVQKAIGI